MSATRHLVILNPAAAMGRAATRLPLVQALLERQGIDHEIRLTERAWHAAELAQAAASEGFGVVVAAGGDGTVNEAINGLMAGAAGGDHAPALATLGVGRGNDFAYGAGIPLRLEAAVSALAAGKERRIDVGRVTGGDYPQGRYFGNGIGIGFDTIVGLEAARLKHVHGFLGYVVGALKTFMAFPPAPGISLEHDGGRHGGKSHQISIMNGRRMGGTFFMAPAAEMDDGLLDLCMAAELNRREMAALIVAYTKGTQASHPKISQYRSTRFHVEAPEGGLAVHADGETICRNGSALTVECFPSALRLVGVDGSRQ